MRTRSFVLLALIMCACMVALWGCPKKAEVTTAPEDQTEEAQAAEEAERARKEQEEARRAAEEEAEARELAAAAEEGLQPVYFDFDESFIRGDARETIKANAEWLKANPGVGVRIEGNTDQRGTTEYNQALGQRRASSAKRYLTDLGIAGSRISLISYGEEKPECTEQTEECWQKNRRADFVVQ